MSRIARPARKGSPSIPATPNMQRNGGKARDVIAQDSDYLDSEDDDIDELMTTIPASSPFFTQPTQVVKRATQPTQILERSTQPTQLVGQASQKNDRKTQPSQIMGTRKSQAHAPSSPGSKIEVPASSPFQARSQAKISSYLMKATTPSRVRSPKPAGTGMESKPSTARSSQSNRPVAKKTYLNISDDELSECYKHHDSSGDEEPMRGDIKPSSFITKGTARDPIEIETPKKNDGDINLKDIHDIRLRHLTKDVYKIVSKTKPTTTIAECREALTKTVGWQVPKAVDLLLREPTNPQSDNALSKDLVRKGKSTSTKPLDDFFDRTCPTKPSRSQGDCSLKTNSTLTASTSTTTTSSTTSVSSTKQASTTKPILPPPPRRRLVQGRQRSPSPPPVFSISSDPSSPPTTPALSVPQSPNSKEAKAVTMPAVADPAPAARPRRRLQRGRRNPSPSPPPPTSVVDSKSDSDSDVPPVEDLISRKRKAVDDPEPEIVEVSSEPDVPSEPEYKEDRSPSPTQILPHEQCVLEYLNSCTAESLAQITGLSAPNAKAMISARPFASFADAENVCKKEAKSKAKAKRVQIGSLFIEKLTAWFAAFQAASEVINQCEDRGKQLQKAMARWPMDKNGKPRDGNTLPVEKKPRLMAADIQLKSYQLLGLNWMNLLHSKGFSGILADDMGLGKTCQVIALIAHLVESYKKGTTKSKPWPFLVVVPPSVCENWMAEFERFAPKLDICVYVGSDRRNIDPREAHTAHVVLTTYSQIEKAKEDRVWLKEMQPYAAVYDEGHRLKNRNNLIYKQMMRVPTQWRLILSGTPVQNNLKELLTLLYFVEPGLFADKTYEQLDSIMEAKVPSKEIHNFALLAKERVSNARTMMVPFILQRRKEDVLDLAKKTETNIVVDMHPKQQEIYNEVRGRYLVEKKQRASSTIKDSNPWMQLRQAAIHHQLFRVHFTDKIVKQMVDKLWKKCTHKELSIQSKDDGYKPLLLASYMGKSDFQLHLECKYFEKYIGEYDIPHRSWEESPKIQKLLELVRGYMETGDRVLVFSRFDLVIDIIRETLAFADIPYCELTGSTSMADRFPEIERFNENPDIPVFLLTTGAGGTGLNLTAANKIIIFDQSDNPQDDVQASNRAHRIGQTREVEVIRLLTRDSVEGLIYNSCVKKLMLARAVEGSIDEDENETIEQQCRKLMMIEEETAGSQPVVVD